MSRETLEVLGWLLAGVVTFAAGGVAGQARGYDQGYDAGHARGYEAGSDDGILFASGLELADAIIAAGDVVDDLRTLDIPGACCARYRVLRAEGCGP